VPERNRVVLRERLPVGVFWTRGARVQGRQRSVPEAALHPAASSGPAGRWRVALHIASFSQT
jgi:hypothetical protein